MGDACCVVRADPEGPGPEIGEGVTPPVARAGFRGTVTRVRCFSELVHLDPTSEMHCTQAHKTSKTFAR